jgi:hypothetical protein
MIKYSVEINPPWAAPIVDQAIPPPALVNLPLIAANIYKNFDLHSISNPLHVSKAQQLPNQVHFVAYFQR